MSVQLEDRGGGVFVAPGARIIDRSGRKRLPIGRDGFVPAIREGTLVDKTLLIADVLDSGYTATLFCRPRRFGKTLNMTMLRAYLESAEAGGLTQEHVEELFTGTYVWEKSGGAYLRYQGVYPVVHLSLRTAKGATWPETVSALRALILAEYQRHSYLLDTATLPPGETRFFEAIMSDTASNDDYADSLIRLTRALAAYHKTPVVVLIDEYDAPVMAAYSAPGDGYYDEAVGFIKRWLTGALKDGGEALAFACLTGVQRISKESIFSDLNNLTVSTPLTTRFDERFGFTGAEVEALATYLGYPGCMPEAREWYDGYRFGGVDVYNPWSVINYLDADCEPDVYWGNTSDNSVVEQLVRNSDANTLEDVYGLLEKGGTVERPLDLGVVFPELGVKGDAVWSMLYLAGYLTTNDVARPNSRRLLRRLRIPNREISELYLDEVVERFAGTAGGASDLKRFQDGMFMGDEAVVRDILCIIARDSMSYLDLTSELSCHALLMGLLFGATGYKSPTFEREAGYGRYDIRMEPDPRAIGRPVRRARPLVTVEVKYASGADGEALEKLAEEALAQIARNEYDVELPPAADGRLRWGVAFSGKHVAVACERA